MGLIWPVRLSGIFFSMGLDDPNQLETTIVIQFLAQWSWCP